MAYDVNGNWTADIVPSSDSLHLRNFVATSPDPAFANGETVLGADGKPTHFTAPTAPVIAGVPVRVKVARTDQRGKNERLS